MDKLILKGRKVVGGVAEGEALVSQQTVSGWGGVDPATGTIIERRNDLNGQSIKGKVFVFRGAKGSSGWSVAFHVTRLLGSAPAAMIFNELTSKIALGAVVAHTPAVTDLDRNPLEAIESGDWVRVDGDNGVVEVTKGGKRS
jgi:predicted aconitase with swiveling domain